MPTLHGAHWERELAPGVEEAVGSARGTQINLLKVKICSCRALHVNLLHHLPAFKRDMRVEECGKAGL